MEDGEGETPCLELADLLLHGLLLLLGWGIAVDEEGGLRAEVAARMLVEEPTFTAGEGAFSVTGKGCEVTPSEESAPGKREILETRRWEASEDKGGSGGEKGNQRQNASLLHDTK